MLHQAAWAVIQRSLRCDTAWLPTEQDIACRTHLTACLLKACLLGCLHCHLVQLHLYLWTWACPVLHPLLRMAAPSCCHLS
jgi:hypothetical protein